MLDKQYVDDTKGNKRQRYYNCNGHIELQTRENGSKIERNLEIIFIGISRIYI